MKLKNALMSYTFDDFVLIPQFTDLKSRKEPDTTTTLGPVKITHPIIASPMNTVTESEMLCATARYGCSAVLHRYMTPQEQVSHILEAQNYIRKPGSEIEKKWQDNFFFAVGANGDCLDRAKHVYDMTGVKNICVDVANGHSFSCIVAVEKLAKLDFSPVIMAGNVATYDGAKRLAQAGATSIRVGIGPGSVCKTRIVTGHGLPLLTSLEDCVRLKEDFSEVSLIADGGIRNGGDVVKAIAIGADVVMIGGLLAGTNESAGQFFVDENGNKYKIYAGMASEEGRKLNGWFDDDSASFAPEGSSARISAKGPAQKVLHDLVSDLRVGMSYSGARILSELREFAEWSRVTTAGYIEGTPHGTK